MEVGKVGWSCMETPYGMELQSGVPETRTHKTQGVTPVAPWTRFPWQKNAFRVY